MIKRSRGFTLLELLVAIVVFALMSAMAYSGLGTALSHSRQAELQAERLAQLQKVFTIMGRDIEQAVNRPVRDNYATELSPMTGGGYGSSVLELSRTGLRNPMEMKRSNLQRVGYMLSEGSLIRQSWFVLDRSLDTQPYEAAMLSDVKAVEMRFMDDNKEWQTQWPDINHQPGDPVMLPQAVEVTLELEDWGRISRIFEVVG